MPGTGRFVPARVGVDEVDAAWESMRRRNPRLFDGPLWHVGGVSRNGHGGVTLHVLESSYRMHAVAASGLHTGVRPLGVKGIVQDGTRLLVGRRSLEAHAYPGAWELLPGGTVEPGSTPLEAFERELREEAAATAARRPVAVALFLDEVAGTWEIVFRCHASLRAESPSADGWEHSERRLVTAAEAVHLGLTPAAQEVLSLILPDAGAAVPRREILE